MLIDFLLNCYVSRNMLYVISILWKELRNIWAKYIVKVFENASRVFWKDAYCAVVLLCQSLSCVLLFVTPQTVAYQGSLSIKFSRQEYWSGLPFPPPGDLPNPGIESASPVLQADSLQSEPAGIPLYSCRASCAVVDACFLYTHKIRVFILCCSNFYDSTEFCCLFLSIMESGILEIFCNGTDSSFCLFVLSVLVEAAYY